MKRPTRSDLLFLVVLYVVAYCILSINGRYEPAIWGLDHVKSYGWAPVGFVNDFQWRKTMLAAFWPLYMVDIRLWHTEDRSDSGTYPINLYIRDRTEQLSEDDVEKPTDIEPQSKVEGFP